MKPKFRFFANQQMTRLTLNDLLFEVYPALSGAPVMMSTGLKPNDQEAFAEDILVLDVAALPDTDMFWHSHLGQAMKEHGFEEAVLHIKATERYDMAFELYIKKGGRFITHNEFDAVPPGSDDYESGNRVFSTIADSRFFRYFCKQHPVIAGNSYQHPELLPGRENEAHAAAGTDEEKAKAFIGKNLLSHACDGLFGPHTANLYGATVTKVAQSKYSNDILVGVLLTTGRTDVALFHPSQYGWSDVAHFLEKWTTHNPK